MNLDEYEKMTWETPSDELDDAVEDLLAEVKRLREWIEQAVDVWENCNHEDRTEWFDNFCEVNKND